MRESIIVHSVSQEYWYLAKCKCSCGGNLESRGQKLLVNQKDYKESDLLEVVCLDCGKQSDFIFDISSFSGPEIRAKQVEIIETIQRKQVGDLFQYARELTPSPVANAVKTIIDLGKQDDPLALEWISDTLDHVKEQLEKH